MVHTNLSMVGYTHLHAFISEWLNAFQIKMVCIYSLMVGHTHLDALISEWLNAFQISQNGVY